MTTSPIISQQGLYDESYLRQCSPQEIQLLIQDNESAKLSAYKESFICGSACALLSFGVYGLCCHLVADIALPIFSAMAEAITPLITVVFAIGASLTVGLAAGYAMVKFTKVIPKLFNKTIEKLAETGICDNRRAQLNKCKCKPIPTS